MPKQHNHPKFLLTLLMIVINSLLLFCQEEPIDLLKKELSSEQKTSARLDILNQLGNAYRNIDTDSSNFYFQAAIETAKEINSEVEILHIYWYAEYLHNGRYSIKADSVLQLILNQPALNSISKKHFAWITKMEAMIELDKGNFEKAGAILLTALDLYHNSDQSLEDMGKIYDNCSNYYGSIGKIDSSIIYLLRADSLFEMANLPHQVTRTNMNLAINYLELDKLAQAQKHALKGLKMAQETGNKKNIAHSFAILAWVLSDLNQPREALNYDLKGIASFQKLNDEYYVAISHRGAGVSYLKLKDYKNASEHFEASVQLFKKFDDDQQVVYSLNRYAFSLIMMRQINKGKEQLQEATLLFENISGDTQFEIDYYENMEQAYAELKDFEQAYQYRKHYDLLQDSIFNTQKLSDIEDIQTKYDVQKKDTKITLQQAELVRKNQRFYIALIFMGLLLISIFLGWKNIQQRKRTNAQLRQLDQTKSRFFANMSHELRTPLTLIIAPIEHAIQQVKSKSAKENLALAHSNSKKLLTLVNEILDLSKLESNKMRLKEKAVSLEKLLRRIFFSYHSLAQLRGFILSFSYHLPKDLVVKVDIDKFEKVLNNLLSNAFKYSNQGGVITLRAEKEKGLLKIEITDTGKGIPPDQLNKIFDRFYQAEGENEPLQGGTGIGLAYAKEIARLFGGELTVKSKIREGSTFTFILPLKKTNLKALPIDDEPLDENERLVSTPILPSSEKKTHILVVEDNPEMSRFLVQSLSPHFQCSTAMDGKQALELLQSGHKPDLITSDVMMPNMDGFAFLEAVHNMENYQGVPFILLTARALEEDKLKGLHLGVDDYLTKPFNTKELIARIQNLLKNKTSRDQYQAEDPSEPENEATFEEKLIKKAEMLVLTHITETDYRIADFAKELAYSPRQLERIFKKTTGLSPVGFIREVRLQKAYELLEKRQFASVAEVRFEVGIENASYFTRKFQERFGKNPKELLG